LYLQGGLGHFFFPGPTYLSWSTVQKGSKKQVPRRLRAWVDLRQPGKKGTGEGDFLKTHFGSKEAVRGIFRKRGEIKGRVAQDGVTCSRGEGFKLVKGGESEARKVLQRSINTFQAVVRI